MAFKSVSESFVFLSVCSLGKKKTDKEERPKENKEVHKHKSIIINICTIYGRGHMLYGVTLMWHFIFPYHGVQHCWRTVSWQEIIALQKGTVFLISNSGLNGLMAGSVAWRITQIIIENSPVKTEVSWTTYSGLSWHIYGESHLNSQHQVVQGFLRGGEATKPQQRWNQMRGFLSMHCTNSYHLCCKWMMEWWLFM